MPEHIYPNIYCNKIPLPNNPLKALNSYAVVSAERNLLIDTGFNQPECEAALLNGIQELGLDLAKTDVLLTHRHSDHTGLAGVLEQRGAKIYTGAREKTAILEMASSRSWAWMNELIVLHGLNTYGITVDDHPGYRYRSAPLADCTALADGDQLHYGDYCFTVVDIPGHTPGQIGLYEKKHRLFFGGDHILASITPNITFWNFEQDSLVQYLTSLEKVKAMDIDWLFTAHRELIRDAAGRVDQLASHHKKRLDEVLAILADGRKSACEVAARMHWEIRAKNWEDFPKAQKWFATGEAAAHLEYLYHAGRIDRTAVRGTLYYG